MVHLFGDVLHIFAAGVWLGGLIPLALLMIEASRSGEQSVELCRQALCRFFNLGIVSVTVLLATGTINTWFLTDRLRGLTGTDYGRLLQIKIGLFVAMFCIAAVNRLWFLPRLSQGNSRWNVQALTQLRRNTALEIVLGLAVIYLVGALGVTPPAGHVHGE